MRLLLGVTPEYASLFDHVVAIDHSAAMIGALWPRHLSGKDAVQADWLRLPIRDGCCDACIGDGSLNLLAYPAQYGLFFDQLLRVLKPGGKMVLRVFVRPDIGESCESVRTCAMSGRIGNFHAFKWRLAMAIAAESGDCNVGVAEVHRVFSDLFPDRSDLAARSGWCAAQIETIDAYRNAAAAYSFPKLTEVRGSFPQNLKEIDLMYGSYELAERCPMFVLQART